LLFQRNFRFRAAQSRPGTRQKPSDRAKTVFASRKNKLAPDANAVAPLTPFNFCSQERFSMNDIERNQLETLTRVRDSARNTLRSFPQGNFPPS